MDGSHSHMHGPDCLGDGVRVWRIEIKWEGQEVPKYVHYIVNRWEGACEAAPMLRSS